MATLLGYPAVEGNLGTKTRRAHAVQVTDDIQANVNAITEAEWAAAGVQPGDLAYVTFSDGVSALYRVPNPFGTIEVYTPAAAL